MQRIVGERQQQKKDSLEQETRYRVKWASVTTGPGAGNWSADEHDSWLRGCQVMLFRRWTSWISTCR